MTRLAGSSALTKDTLVIGRYPCWGASRDLFDLVIRSASSYDTGTGSAGQYRFDAATKKIKFLSGPRKGYGAILLRGPTVGLNANNSNFYSTTCSLKR